MINKLEIFKNEEFGEVRVLEINNEPWFVGKDVAEILGYSNSRKALLDHVDVEDKGVTKCDTLGGQQELAVINESGLYSLILSSKLPMAKRFKKWVTSSILPTIRKTGGYVSNEEAFISTYLPFASEDTKALFSSTLKTIREQNEAIKELQPKADYFDELVERNMLTNLRDTAKELKIAPGTFNNYLIENGYLYRNSKGQLKPYQTKVEKGLFELKEFTNKNGYADTQTLVTPKGRETFRLLVKNIK